MIIQRQKPIAKIIEMLSECRKVFIVGCSACATTCKTGGEPEVAAMNNILVDSGRTVTGTCVFNPACLLAEVRKKYAAHKAEIDAADCLIVLACGSGAQCIGDYLGKKTVVTGVDALFVGEISRVGQSEEKCRACGECIMDYTDGICPVTRCAKGLLNGPCGGYKDGKCESDPTKNCAWMMIYERLKERGHLDKMKTAQPPIDYSNQHTPRHLERKKTGDAE